MASCVALGPGLSGGRSQAASNSTRSSGERSPVGDLGAEAAAEAAAAAGVDPVRGAGIDRHHHKLDIEA